MLQENENTQPPEFGETWPIYPPLDQLVRVTASALAGTSPAIYPGLLVQFDPASLTSRNRVAVYVVEPNNITLSPAIYDSRLVGAYQAPSDANPVPLFAATCCLAPAASKSSSSASSRAGGGISVVQAGTAGSATNSVVINNVTANPGDIVFIYCGALCAPSIGVTFTVTYAGNACTKIDAVSIQLDALTEIAGGIFWFVVTTPTSNQQVGITARDSGLNATAVVGAVEVVSGLTSATYTPDGEVTNGNGNAQTSADLGNMTIAQASAEYIGAVLIGKGTAVDGTWQNGFAMHQTVTAGGISMRTAGLITSATGTYDPKITGMTKTAWAGVSVSKW